MGDIARTREEYEQNLEAENSHLRSLLNARAGDAEDHARVVRLTAEVKRLEAAGSQMFEANNVANARIKELGEAVRGMLRAAKRGWDDCSVCGVELAEGEAHREDCEVFFAECALAGKEAARQCRLCYGIGGLHDKDCNIGRALAGEGAEGG